MMTMKRILLTASAAVLIAGTQAAAQGQNAPRPPTTPQAAPAAPAEKSAPGVTAPRGTLNNAPDRGQSDATGDATGDDTRRPGNAQNDRSPTHRNGQAADEQKRGGAAATNGKDNGKDNGKNNGMNARASAPAKLSSEQRTKITTVIKEKHVQPARVNFDIRVGAAVPRSVHLTTLPPEVIEVYPAWRGYEFILVADEIVIIDPNTLHVVAVLPA
jgi:hypothetical protein